MKGAHLLGGASAMRSTRTWSPISRSYHRDGGDLEVLKDEGQDKESDGRTVRMEARD